MPKLDHFVNCSKTSCPGHLTFIAPTLLPFHLCQSFLDFALLSSYIIISLSLPLSLPRSPGFLRNVQLYLFQLRILIFPMRQSARVNEERKENDLDLRCLVNSITPPINVICNRALLTGTTKHCVKVYVSMCLSLCL